MTRLELVAPRASRIAREVRSTFGLNDARRHGHSPAAPVRRCLAARIAAVGIVMLAGCGGGGSDGPAGAGAGAAAAPTTAAASGPVNGTTSASAASAGQTGNPSSSTAGSTTGGDGGPAASNAGSGSSRTALAPLSDLAYYRLGISAPNGTATVRAGSLDIDGRQSSGAVLVAGSCNGGTAFKQCAGTADANVFTLCSNDGGTGPDSDRIRSRYVLFDPAAERVTDATVLRNLSFNGFENCGQDNVGTQSKSAPSATLRFDGNGNLTLTRFDRDPARSSTLPAFLVDLNNDTVSGGQSARFNVYRSNGRYLIIATSVPTAGASAGDPGTLIAFMQQ